MHPCTCALRPKNEVDFSFDYVTGNTGLEETGTSLDLPVELTELPRHFISAVIWYFNRYRMFKAEWL
jgi:hypothetical protein